MQLKLIAPSQQKLQKIAECAHIGLEVEQIALVTGLGIETVRNFMDLEDYKKIANHIDMKYKKREDQIREGWAAVEKRGLKNVLSYMEQANDPEFALKAASMANRATFNRQALDRNNRPLQQPDGHNVVPIEINQNFMIAIQNGERLNKSNGKIDRKAENTLGPGNVTKMLDQFSESRNKFDFDAEFEKEWEEAS